MEEDGKLPLEGRKARREAGGRAQGRCPSSISSPGPAVLTRAHGSTATSDVRWGRRKAITLEMGPQKVRDRSAGESKGTQGPHLTLLPEQIPNEECVPRAGSPTHAYFKQGGRRQQNGDKSA